MTVDITTLTSRQACVEADNADELAHLKTRFVIPDGTIYLDGNSLGVMPVSAPERAREVIEQEWGRDLIASWNTHHWFDLPVRIGEKIANLVGGSRGACVATDTTSVNLFKALGAAIDIQR